MLIGQKVICKPISEIVILCNNIINFVQEACAECFAVHILKFEVL